MGVTYIEGLITEPTKKQKSIRFLVESGANYTLLPYDDWQAIELSPRRA
jgi:hypothetical protein